MENRNVHLLLCCNRGYVQHLAVLLVSLARRNRDLTFHCVVVSGDDLGEERGRLLGSLNDCPNVRLRLHRFRVPESLGLPVRAHYALDNYARLWVADFFDGTVEKVLYLDCDMVVLGSLRGLWNADLQGHLLGAVSIPGSTRCAVLGIPEAHGYFNSGVMLIDLAQWRASRAFETVIAYATGHRALLHDVDQDALNACFHDRRAVLAPIWNGISPFYFDYHPLGLDAEALARFRHDVKIVHFNGASKPWSYTCRHPRKREYDRILALTRWRHVPPPDRTLFNRLKTLAWWIAPPALWRWARRLQPGRGEAIPAR